MAISSGTSRVDLATWDPENETTWDSRFVWRTLWITTYNLTLAFCAWYLVSAIALRPCARTCVASTSTTTATSGSPRPS